MPIRAQVRSLSARDGKQSIPATVNTVPYRIKAGTNFYSLINNVPKNYNTKKEENSKQKNSVAMKSQ